MYSILCDTNSNFLEWYWTCIVAHFSFCTSYTVITANRFSFLEHLMCSMRTLLTADWNRDLQKQNTYTHKQILKTKSYCKSAKITSLAIGQAVKNINTACLQWMSFSHCEVPVVNCLPKLKTYFANSVVPLLVMMHHIFQHWQIELCHFLLAASLKFHILLVDLHDH